MAPPPLPPPALPKAAQPRHAPAFDPWNSSSTGHQRAEQRQLTGWRDLRNGQLNHQLRGRGRNGPAAGAKTGAGAGAGAGVGAKTGAAVLEKKSKNSVVDMLRQPGLMETPRPAATPSSSSSSSAAAVAANTATTTTTSSSNSADVSSGGRGIFAGTTIHVNGSTFPHISDHKLKHVLAEHGARMSLHLGRRAVTHVVLGSGGGGLAGGKADREIRRVRGCGVYFVGVEWVLESVKAGKRLSEARFARGSSPAGQASVYNKCRP